MFSMFNGRRANSASCIPDGFRKILVVEPAIGRFLLFAAGIENTIIMEAEV